MAGSVDGGLTIINPMNGVIVKKLKSASQYYANDIESLDNNNFITGGRYLLKWNIQSQNYSVITKTGIDVSVLRYTSEKNIVAVGLANSTIEIWNLDSLQTITKLQKHTNKIQSIEFLSDSSMLSSSCFNIFIWNTTTWDIKSDLSNMTSSSCIRSSVLMNSTVWIAGFDKNIKLINLKNRLIMKTIAGHSSAVISLDILANGQLISGSFNGEVKIWDIDNGVCVINLNLNRTGTPDLSNVYTKSLMNGRFLSRNYNSTELIIWN